MSVDGSLNLGRKVEHRAIACQADAVKRKGLFPIRVAGCVSHLRQQVEGIEDTGVTLRVVESDSAGVKCLCGNRFNIGGST